MACAGLLRPGGPAPAAVPVVVSRMQCQHPAYLNTREALAKIAGNLVRAFQVIDQQERGLKEPRSLAQLTHEVGSSLAVGLRWLRKLDFCKESAASAR